MDSESRDGYYLNLDRVGPPGANGLAGRISQPASLSRSVLCDSVVNVKLTNPCTGSIMVGRCASPAWLPCRISAVSPIQSVAGGAN